MAIAAHDVPAAGLEVLSSHPELAGLVAEILWQGPQSADDVALLTHLLAALARSMGATAGAVFQNDSGHWRAVARHGAARPAPGDLLSEALDRAEACVLGTMVAAPLAPEPSRGAGGEVFWFEAATSRVAGEIGRKLRSLSPICGGVVSQARARHAERRRIERLEAVLGIAGQWNQTNEMEPLLVQMAEAATRLLGADRASIFLWDRPNHVLIGRPALGVPGGELRVPDDAGVVGQVIASGQPRRIRSGDQAQINRQVDLQLGYQTRTLLCAPLRSGAGDLFGAFEVINKHSGDFTADDEAALVELANHAAVALENTQQLEQLLASHRRLVDQAAERVKLIGSSPAVDALRSIVRRVAETDLAILILGENGTGKEVVSQLLHYLSPRRDRPFIAVNCAAIAETLLESELFGHEKGAFTDAHESRVGKFELAAGGTLFLDEIGDLSPSGQAKLLRVLEEKVVVRVGGSKPIHADARVVAATNQNLADMVRQRRFRQDLYFRLNVVTLELPPLRDRGDDVTLLAEHFLADFCRKAHRRQLKITAAARKRLQAHSWPGNVRELRNVMERLAYLSPDEKVDADDLAFMISPGSEPPPLAANLPLAEATEAFQIDHIQRTIDRAGGNMSLAAERLGLHRSNLYRKMRQLGMPTGD